jgi:DNA-binding transcriptional ArsR family regulator
MKDSYYIEVLDQAQQLLKPRRVAILQQLAEPRTCTELAELFEQTPQQIYYHVKALENAGLVRKVAERRVRGTVEGHYQAVARSYWLAPGLVGQVGTPRQAEDQASLRLLLSLMEEVQADVGRLGQQTEVGQHVPSLGLAAEISLPAAVRPAFLAEVQQLFNDLAEKYSVDAAAAEPADPFRLILACYPDRNLN